MSFLKDKNKRELGDPKWYVTSGAIEGIIAINKFGQNTDIGTGAAEDIWDGGGTWVEPTAARIHAIVSTSGDDAAAGTGAQTVKIFGLDSNYDLIDETVTMNGVGGVNTTKSFTMIHRMFVVTGGSGGANAGDITATAAVDGTVTAQITTGFNQTLMAIYQCPAGYTGLVLEYDFSINKGAGPATADATMVFKEPGGVYQTKHIIGVQSTGTSYLRKEYPVPQVLPEKAIIKLRATVSANGTDLSGGFVLIMIENSKHPEWLQLS